MMVDFYINLLTSDLKGLNNCPPNTEIRTSVSFVILTLNFQLLTCLLFQASASACACKAGYHVKTNNRTCGNLY
jgi:hypothetical protein